MHWADKGPHKNERSALIVEGSTSEDESADEINIVLIKEEIDKAKIFVAEASKSAVVKIHSVYHLNLVTGESSSLISHNLSSNPPWYTLES